jgi:primosomal protein N'
LSKGKARRRSSSNGFDRNAQRNNWRESPSGACAPVRDGVVRLLGPAPAPIARLRGRYRHRFLLRSADRRALRQVAAAVAARVDEGLSPARASVDIDPFSML